MGERSVTSSVRRLGLCAALAVGVSGAAGCPQKAIRAPSPAALPAQVVADFEAAVLRGPDAFVDLFDFAAVGELEILLHRYDLNGRLVNLDERQKAELAAEDGTPYPAERERRNVGNFYKILAQRTVGTGGCVAREPRTKYGKLLGTYPPLPAGTPPKYEELRAHASAWIAKGGVVGLACKGGQGGLALVYTARDAARDGARGFDLITIYDD